MIVEYLAGIATWALPTAFVAYKLWSSGYRFVGSEKVDDKIEYYNWNGETVKNGGTLQPITRGMKVLITPTTPFVGTYCGERALNVEYIQEPHEDRSLVTFEKVNMDFAVMQHNPVQTHPTLLDPIRGESEISKYLRGRTITDFVYEKQYKDPFHDGNQLILTAEMVDKYRGALMVCADLSIMHKIPDKRSRLRNRFLG